MLYSPWPALACTLLALLLVSTPWFRAADEPAASAGRREEAIDGLRGLAAFGVYLHHAAITHDYLAEGVWRLPPSRFFSMAGQVGVAVFFVITGFLFWGKLVREGGRPRWLALFVGRVFRIGPVYTVAMVAIVAIVLARSGWALVEPPGKVLSEFTRWMCLGILGGVPLNADPATTPALGGVTWTLKYEWSFYALLPLLAVGTLRRRWALPVALGLWFAATVWRSAGLPWIWSPNDPVYALLFAGGAVCASLREDGRVVPGPAPLLSLGALSAVAATFALFPTAYALAPASVLALSFLLVMSGGDVFGLLSSRPARRLGDISYGIYMLQGPVLFLAFRPIAIRSAALGSPLAYWAVVFAAAAALIAAATFVHRWVEVPGIRAGRELVGAIGSRFQRRGAATAVQFRR